MANERKRVFLKGFETKIQTFVGDNRFLDLKVFLPGIALATCVTIVWF